MNQSSNQQVLEDSLDWELWTGDFPFWKHAVSGSCAGVMEHVLLFPLDTIKTRVQAMKSSIISHTSSSIEKEYKGGGSSSIIDMEPQNNFKTNYSSLNRLNSPIESIQRSSNFYHNNIVLSDSLKESIVNNNKSLNSTNAISSTPSISRFYTYIFRQLGVYSYKSGELRASIRDLIQEGGFFRFFRGVTAITYGCMPAHAFYFSVYEIMKYHFGVGSSSNYSAIQSAICGAAATVSHDFILTPMDLVKQRLQLGCYNGVFDCIRTVLKNEGPHSFFRSMPTTLVMNIPFGAVTVSTNELMKHLLGIASISSESYVDSHKTNISNLKDSNNELNILNKSDNSDTNLENSKISETMEITNMPSHSYSSTTLLSLYFVCAGVGGGVAGFVTNPLDVIKTRLQTQDIELQREISTQSSKHFKRISPIASMKYISLLSTIKTMWKEERILGFWRGTLARITLSIPATAVSWGTYESVKYLLTLNSIL